MAQNTPSFTPDDDKSELASRCHSEPAVLAEVVAALAGEDRRARQFAASVVHEVAIHDASLLKPFAGELADALHRPESQTRWEVLGIFEKLVPVDARLVDKALAGAETALHDEESGVVRLAASDCLTSYGATTAHRSERVWPLIDDAIRCYHGDAEFPPMLSGLYRMVSGAASDEVKLGRGRAAWRSTPRTARGCSSAASASIVACAPQEARQEEGRAGRRVATDSRSGFSRYNRSEPLARFGQSDARRVRRAARRRVSTPTEKAGTHGQAHRDPHPRRRHRPRADHAR